MLPRGSLRKVQHHKPNLILTGGPSSTVNRKHSTLAETDEWSPFGREVRRTYARAVAAPIAAGGTGGHSHKHGDDSIDGAILDGHALAEPFVSPKAVLEMHRSDFGDSGGERVCGALGVEQLLACFTRLGVTPGPWA